VGLLAAGSDQSVERSFCAFRFDQIYFKQQVICRIFQFNTEQYLIEIVILKP